MDARTKKSTIADAWRQRVLAQQGSGRPIRQWCRENRCAEHAFYCWRVRLGLSPATGKPRRRRVAGKPIGFTRLVLESSPRSDATVEPIRLSLVGGRELALPMSMPVEQIARLVRAIEGAGPEPACGELVERVEGAA
jgi:hypothetical protein